MKIICQSSSHLESESHIHPHIHHPSSFSITHVPTTLPSLSLPSSHLISFINHFPHCRVTNMRSSQTCLSYYLHSSHSFSFLTSDFIKFSSHILVSKPLYSSIAHCFYLAIISIISALSHCISTSFFVS